MSPSPRRAERTAAACALLAFASLAIPRSAPRALHATALAAPHHAAAHGTHSLADPALEWRIRTAFATQHIASGTAVVLDVESGAVLAAPTIAPTTTYPAEAPRPVARAFAEAQNPGFTFAPFSLLAALQAGMISEHSTIDCSGELQIGGYRWDLCMQPHGDRVGLVRALREHCYFYLWQVARDTGVDAIVRMAHEFGFAQRTGVVAAGEAAGFVDTFEETRRSFGHVWSGYRFELASGVRRLAVTPIQLARAWGALATGRLVTPRIDDASAQIRRTSIGVDANLRNQMLAALDASTADPTSPMVGLSSRPNALDANREDLATRVGWYAGFFPRAHPRYVTVVQFDDATMHDERPAAIARAVAEYVLAK